MTKHSIIILLVVLSFLLGCALRKYNGVGNGVSVNLSRQGLTEIPEEVFFNTDIKVLRLYGNRIDSLPDEIGQLVNLEKLYVGKNNLKYISPEIASLKKLKLFSAQYNELETLPESIGELENLEQLILNQNKLKEIPKTIGNLQKLEVLQLKFNQLEELPKEIGNCEELQFIHLNRNFLREIPIDFGNLRKLRELRVSGAGPLLTLSESLCGLRYFEVLEIDPTIVVPQCLLVQQTTRLQIIMR